MRALVIDDDPVAIAVVTDGLKACGVTDVLSATCSREAVDLFDAWRDDIDLVVSDLHMPDFDGMEFLTMMSEKKADCAVIIISSAADPIRAAASALGLAGKLQVVGTLKKPLRLSELQGALAKMKERHQTTLSERRTGTKAHPAPGALRRLDTPRPTRQY